MIDAIVLGAGPSGALAARELARRGHRVRLIDKAQFPRTKVCGSTLNGHALESLRAAGLGTLADDLGAVTLRRFQLLHAGKSVTIALERHRALSRSALDSALVDAAAMAGVEVATGCSGRIVRTQPSHVEVELTHAGSVETIRSAVVIAADGLGSRALGEPLIAKGSRIGAATIVERQDGYSSGSLTLAVGRLGYVGIVALEDGRLDVAAALDKDAAKSGVGASVAVILSEAGAPRIEGLANAAFLGAPALTRRPVHVARDRVFAIGDAAGYVEPFTGEGIGWALESGLLVVPFAAARIAGATAADHEYSARFSNTIRRRQQLCRAIAWTLRRRPLLALTMSALTTFSGLGRAVLSHLDAAPRGVRA